MEQDTTLATHPAVKLGALMARIGKDAADLSRALRANGQTIRLPGSFQADPAPLFQTEDRNGEILQAVFHYSKDLRGMDPDAQLHLMLFFGNLHAVSAILSAPEPAILRPAAIAMLDQIMAKAVFFERFFARLDISMDILLSRVSGDEVGQKARALSEVDADRARATADQMSEPDKIATYVPADDIPFLISAEGPGAFEPINGVPFPPEMAEQVRAYLARQQADAFNQRAVS